MVDTLPDNTDAFGGGRARCIDELRDELLRRQDADWSCGVRTSIDQLIGEWPELSAQSELLLDLIHNEVYLRLEYGEVPELTDYQRRFPNLAEGLRIQWEVDQLLFAESVDSAERSPLDLSVRHRIGRYEVQLKLGEGGIGVAYKAWDPVLRRIVALKLLKSGRYATTQELARFRTEAEAIARVKHENVVQVYDVGEVGGEPFIAMEYCAGGTLADRLQRSLLSPREAAQIVRHIAHGVAAVHQMQIIHRDLKPANVFLQPLDSSAIVPAAANITTADMADDSQQVGAGLSGVATVVLAMAGTVDFSAAPKVSDFGLAKLIDDDDRQTRTGMLLGTPAYMAPEQASGGLLGLSPAVDIYALGAILYECLTGRPPFRGTTAAETLDQVRSHEPVPIRQLQPHVPIDLQTIALKCLSKEPHNRYGSMDAVVAELDRFLNNKPILARPISLVERLWRWCRRNPGVAALSGSVLMLLMCLTIGSSLAAVLLKLERDSARTSEQKAIEADGERLAKLYQAYLGEIRASRRSGTLGQREEGLQALRSIIAAYSDRPLTDLQQAELRDEAIASLALPDFRVALRRPAMLVGEATFLRGISSTGQYPEWNSTTAEISVRNISDGALRAQLPGIKPSSTGAITYTFSDCGRWLAEASNDTEYNPPAHLKIWDWHNQQLAFERKLPEVIRLVSIHSGTGTVFVTGSDSVLRRFDLNTGQQKSESPRRFDANAMALDASGKQLAVVGERHTAEIIDTETSKTIQVLQQAGAAKAVGWNHATGIIAIGSNDGRIYLWDQHSETGRFLPGKESTPITDVRWSPDGSCLALNTERGVKVLELDGKPTVSYIPGQVFGFFDDGKCIVTYYNKELVCYSRDRYSVRRTLPRFAEYAQFNPSGSLLALSGTEGVKFHDGRTLSELATLHLDHAGVVAFDPLGRDLITFGRFSHTWRWPITGMNDSAGLLKLGPASSLPIPKEKGLLSPFALEPHHYGRNSAWTSDGRLLAIAGFRHGQILIWNREGGSAPVPFADFPLADRVAISSDGQFIAAAATIFPKGAVWSVADQRQVLHIPDVRHVAFSPDGKWFAMSTWDRVFLYQVGTSFELRRTIERTQSDIHLATAVAFTPDSRLMAMAGSRSQIHLITLDSGRTLASLSHPEEAHFNWLSFTADGARLAVTRLGLDVAVWDLSQLGSRLAELGLEHGAFPSSPATLPEQTTRMDVDRGQLPAPVQWPRNWRSLAMGAAAEGKIPEAISDVTSALMSVPSDDDRTEAELLHLRGSLQLQTGDFHAVLGDWERSLQLTPKSNVVRLGICRLLLFGPSALRNPDRVVTLLSPRLLEQMTVQVGTDLQNEWVLYGCAQIRTGRDREGLDILAMHPSTVSDPPSKYLEALALMRTADRVAALSKFQEAGRIHAELRPNVSAVVQDEWDRVFDEVAPQLK